jgi:signal peptidase I
MVDSQNPFFEKSEKKKTNPGTLILGVLSACCLIFIICWFTVLGKNQVQGPSMNPNFTTGEFIFLNTIPTYLKTPYQRGEVVVYQKPGYPDFVKRVLGLPGDEVAIKNCFVYINNKKLIEYYLPSGLCTNAGTFIQEGADAIKVPEGYYWTVGDNRPQSLDGRFVEMGFTKFEWIKGSVFLRVWPINKFNFIGIGEFKLE